MGGTSLSQGLLIAALYPLNGFRASAFVQPRAIFGQSSWTHQQQEQRQQQQHRRREPCRSMEGGRGRRPRERGFSCCGGVRMQMDATDTETGVPDVVPASLTQFDNRER